MARIRRVDSKREMEKQIDDFVTMGYKVENQGQHSAKVKEKDWGSAPIHAIVFFFSFLAAAVAFDAAGVSSAAAWIVPVVASAAYAAYSRYSAEEVLIRVESEDDE